MNLNRVKGKRAEANLTQAEIARRLMISEATYRLKEKGDRQFTANEIAMLSEILKVEPAYFFTK